MGEDSGYEMAVCMGGPLDGERVRVRGVKLYYPIWRPTVYVPASQDRPTCDDDYRTGSYTLTRRGIEPRLYVHDT